MPRHAYYLKTQIMELQIFFIVIPTQVGIHCHAVTLLYACGAVDPALQRDDETWAFMHIVWGGAIV